MCHTPTITCEGYNVRVHVAISLAGVFGAFVFTVFRGADFPDPLPVKDDSDERGQNLYSDYEMVDHGRRRRNQRTWPEGRMFPGWRINIHDPDSPDS